MNTDSMNQLFNQINSHDLPIKSIQAQFTSKHSAASVTFQDNSTLLVYATKFSTKEVKYNE